MKARFAIRVAGPALALLVAACSSQSGGSPGTSSAGSSVAPSARGASGQSGPPATPGSARPAVAAPVDRCGNHLRMALIMGDPAQPLRAQVATFTHAARPAAPQWEVTAFQKVATRFSATAAAKGKRAALTDPAFGYPSLLQVCRASAPRQGGLG